MANKDAYTRIKEGSKLYKKVMDNMGICIKKGGYVYFRHFMEFTQNKDGHTVRTDYADVVLYWP